MTKIGTLRIWHNSNFGKPPFNKCVKDINEAKLLLDTIANYDLYLGEKIQNNAQGLEIYVGLDVDYETTEGFVEWEDEEGRNIDEIENDDGR